MSRPRVSVIAPSVIALLVTATGLALGASPAALWHMDETSGSTMTDSSGHGLNGKLEHVQTGVAGIGGSKGYGFNGSSSRVIVSDAPGLNPGSKDLVVSVHVAFTSDPGDDYDLIRKGSPVHAGRRLEDRDRQRQRQEHRALLSARLVA